MSDFKEVSSVLGKLPVAEVADAMASAVEEGDVGVLAAPTGSGKSLLLSAKLAERSDDQVVVLMPRRLLAVDAARNIAEMTGTELGQEVGYALGRRPKDISRFSDNTKLLFCTYGYALGSGLINSAKTIVLDEVHEKGEAISLTRAILHRRKRMDPSLRILEMSATVDAQHQAEYWADVAQPAACVMEKGALVTQERHVVPGVDSPASVATELLEEGRKGIAIFVSGVREVTDTVIALRNACGARGMSDVEIYPIYSDLTDEERTAALAPPEPGHRKIIVGTNVIESGVNMRWVDAGISDGKGKLPFYYHGTGAEALQEGDLPQWRIIQQRGRINRDPAYSGFKEGVFVLCASKPMAGRPKEAMPELERVNPMATVFRAASLGLNPATLKFDVQLPKERICESREALQRLGLIGQGWELTEDGKFVAALPVSPEGGAMLAEARRLDEKLEQSGKHIGVLNDAITLVAIMETGGLRANLKTSHSANSTSDLLDAYVAYRKLGSESMTPEACKQNNISFKRYNDAHDLEEELRRRLQPDSQMETPYDTLKQVILHGGVNRLFMYEMMGMRDLLRGNYGFNRDIATAMEVGHSPLTVGRLRMIPSDGLRPDKFILREMTNIPVPVFLRWAADHPQTVLSGLTQSQEKQAHDAGPKQKGKKAAEECRKSTCLEGKYFGCEPLSLRITPDLTLSANKALERLLRREESRVLDFEEAQKKGKPKGYVTSLANEREGARGRRR